MKEELKHKQLAREIRHHRNGKPKSKINIMLLPDFLLNTISLVIVLLIVLQRIFKEFLNEMPFPLAEIVITALAISVVLLNTSKAYKNFKNNNSDDD